MKYILKNTTHILFFEEFERIIRELTVMISSATIAKETVNQQIERISNYLIHHIYPSAEEFIELLDCSYDWDDVYATFHGLKRENKTETQREKDRLNNLVRSSRKIVKYLSIIDSIVDSSFTHLIKTINEKYDFILGKLNQLYGDEYYGIYLLFELNDIALRGGEVNELIENLVKKGYIIPKKKYSFYPEYQYVKISVKGAAYIERKNKKTNHTGNNSLEKKINEILEHLTKLGCGQEIIFNEIEELKELQYTLSKKSWSQLLKSKLVDLALGQAISKETANFVYEYLTNEGIKLLR
jgi:hypothetical protein